MDKLFKNLGLPKALQGADSAKVEMSFMERGSFESQFAAGSIVGHRLVAVAEELGAEEDRARMM